MSVNNRKAHGSTTTCSMRIHLHRMDTVSCAAKTLVMLPNQSNHTHTHTAGERSAQPAVARAPPLKCYDAPCRCPGVSTPGLRMGTARIFPSAVLPIVLVKMLLVSKNFPTYPWNIPQTQNQQFMKEFLSFGGLGRPGVCSRGMLVFS